MNVNLYILIGLPGSGKSTYAKILNTQIQGIVISTDAIRKEIYGSEENQTNSKAVFQIAFSRIKENLQHGVNVIFDATNLISKHRIQLLNEMKQYFHTATAVVVATPYEECLKNNLKRQRHVPEAVIKKMLQQFMMPFYDEGFDKIIIHYNEPEYKGLYGKVEDTPKIYANYVQNNPYHPEKFLGLHLKLVVDKAKTSLLKQVGYLHDIGKPLCRITNKKGYDSFYGHANVSAYQSLFYKDVIDSVLIAAIITYHMLPYSWETEKAVNKFKSQYPLLYNFIIEFNVADKNGKNL